MSYSRSSTSNSIPEKSELPPLNYSLRIRKISISITWFLIVFDSCILPVAIWYPLWYGSNMSKTNVMTIFSCLAGMVSLAEFFWRGWVLIRDHDRRPLGGKWWTFDIFQWIYAVAVVGVTLELVFGTIPNYPNIGLCSMPTATVMFIAAGGELLMTIGYLLNIRLPIRISSSGVGDICRPGVYYIIEDVVAVEGGGRTKFREELNARYAASYSFRVMLVKLSLFWSIPAIAVAAGVTAVVWTTSAPVAIGIGWCVPFIWGLVWALATFWWVPRMLRQELRDFNKTDARI